MNEEYAAIYMVLSKSNGHQSSLAPEICRKKKKDNILFY